MVENQLLNPGVQRHSPAPDNSPNSNPTHDLYGAQLYGNDVNPFMLSSYIHNSGLEGPLHAGRRGIVSGYVFNT